MPIDIDATDDCVVGSVKRENGFPNEIDYVSSLSVDTETSLARQTTYGRALDNVRGGVEDGERVQIGQAGDCGVGTDGDANRRIADTAIGSSRWSEGR